MPARARAAVGGTSNQCVQSREIKQRHHRFGALDDVGDGLRVQRMNGPEKCDGERERSRRFSELRAEFFAFEGAPQDSEKEQRVGEMNGEVERVPRPRL